MAGGRPVEKLNAWLAPWSTLLGRLRPLAAFAAGAVALAVVLATDGGKAAACRLQAAVSGNAVERLEPVRNPGAYAYLALEDIAASAGRALPAHGDVLERRLPDGAREYAWRHAGKYVRYRVTREDGVWIVDEVTPGDPGWCARP